MVPGCMMETLAPPRTMDMTSGSVISSCVVCGSSRVFSCAERAEQEVSVSGAGGRFPAAVAATRAAGSLWMK